jgi:hypothetical protein
MIVINLVFMLHVLSERQQPHDDKFWLQNMLK